MRRCSLLALLLLLAISCTDEYGRLGVDGSAIDRTFEASIEAPTDSAGTTCGARRFSAGQRDRSSLDPIAGM